MRKSNMHLGSNLARLDATTDEDIARQIAEDPDTAPELTDAQLAEAEIWEGVKFIRRVGRPKGSGAKELVTLRLDRTVIEYFRTGGPGWQTRLNNALRELLEGRSARPAMSGRNQHVIPHEGKWAVKGEGNQRATSIHETQDEATERAREIARRQRSELLVHGRDGQIRSLDSFGLDPLSGRSGRFLPSKKHS